MKKGDLSKKWTVLLIACTLIVTFSTPSLADTIFDHIGWAGKKILKGGEIVGTYFVSIGIETYKILNQVSYKTCEDRCKKDCKKTENRQFDDDEEECIERCKKSCAENWGAKVK